MHPMFAILQQHNVLRPDTENNLLGGYTRLTQPFLFLGGRHYSNTAHQNRIYAVFIPLQLRIVEVHLWDPYKTCYKEVDRVIENLLRCSNLLDNTVFHDNNAVT